jgi:hypothetical protein
MAVNKISLNLHVTINADKHPAIYAALISVGPRARVCRLMTITEAALGNNGPGRAIETNLSSACDARASTPVDDLGSLLGFSNAKTGRE